MENFKFILISIIILTGVTFIGYWAFFTLEPGDVHVNKEIQKQLEDKNNELEDEVAKLKSELGALQSAQEQQDQQTQDAVQATPETKPSDNTTSTKYQSLIDDIKKLIDDKVYMKEKSAGIRVGTLQTFLNIYNDTSKKVDNDYGPGTKIDVMAFQKAEGLTADGETGPNTYQKMIDWLKKQ